MILNRFYALKFILIVFLAGCKSASVIQTDQPVSQVVTAPDSQNELRGLYVTINSTASPDQVIFDSNLTQLIKNASKANFNVVFMPYSSYVALAGSTGGKNEMNLIDPFLERLIEESHQYGLKTYFTVDLNNLLIGNRGDDFQVFLNQNSVTNETLSAFMEKLHQGIESETPLDFLLSDQIFPYLKTYLKSNLRRIIETYDIDGVSLDLSYWMPVYHNNDEQPGNNNSIELSTDDENITEIRLKDLIEDLLVETMHVKPYLVNSVTYPGSKDHAFIISGLEENLLDFAIPIFDLNDEDLLDELSELWNLIDDTDKNPESIFPCFMNINPERDKAVLEDLMAFNRETGSQGACILVNSTGELTGENLNIPYEFANPEALPEGLKKRSPFEVAGLKVENLFNPEDQDRKIQLFSGSKAKMVDSDGSVGFVLAHPDSIDMEIAGRKTYLSTHQWSVPYRYTIYPGNEVVREDAWVEFRRMPVNHTNNETYHLLCKTEYPATAWINNDSVKVYKTGIFFNEINLKEGPNRIRAKVLTSDSLSAFYEMEFIYKKDDRIRPAFPLWIDPKTVQPVMDYELLSEDVVTITFEGSIGQLGYIELFPGGEVIKCSRKDFKDHSQYMADVHLSRLDKDRDYQFVLNLETIVDTIKNRIYKFPMENTITVRDPDYYPVVRVNKENTRLTYNLGPIRLGGPIRSELDSGVMMKVNGRMGDQYRIRLNQIENSMVRQDQVEVLPVETLPPSYFITNISCGPGMDEDIVSIPYLEPVPYAILPQPDLNRIVITLYGVKTSSTWISHRKGRKIVDKVTWQQTAPETYQVYVNLKTARIWGYDLQPDGRQLVLRIKYAPEYDLNYDKPLAGLKIAIEAGHGGESTGAMGLSGILEKDINLDLALKFGALCEKMGAQIFQVRETDETIGLLEKRRKALASGADLLISIHANAAGTSRGYLRVPGTSTYYNNPFWAPLAENVYDRLLELGLAEFGVVGSFNYTVIRVSQMPTILVEQAFMTHAEDEEKLADPGFREKMAIKIYEGIVDYLSFMNNDAD